MNEGQQFVDYYAVLQVSPHCDAKVLESAYHSLAKLHHPDHSGTADSTQFNDVTAAFTALRDPDRRAEYDQLYFERNPEARFESGQASGAEEFAAAQDADDHAKVLAALYKRRRENSKEPGIGQFLLQEMLGCTDEHFEFLSWYLKEKGFIVLTEQGTLAITIQGVDHVIAAARGAKAKKLLSDQSGEAADWK